MTDHRIAAESLLDGELEDHADVSTLTSAAAHALLAIHDTLKDIAGNTAEQYAVLVEIRDRLPERATLHDLEDVAAEFGVDLSDVEPAPADVDPDEALAKVAFGEYMLCPSWDEAEPDMRKAWVDVARAAREHIEANERHKYDILMRELNEQNARAEKAEADLARVTKERDEQTRDAIEWRNRYGALRADVAEYVGCMGAVSAFTQVQLLAVRNRLKSILAADANRVVERAES